MIILDEKFHFTLFFKLYTLINQKFVDKIKSSKNNFKSGILKLVLLSLLHFDFVS